MTYEPELEHVGVYYDTTKQMGDSHLMVFATGESTWLAEHDPKGVVWRYLKRSM